jgi:SAM-dependent methyltransferase
MFKSALESHKHSLLTLNMLYEYDDFMRSIRTLADIGCGEGLDLEWWATRTTRDPRNPQPLNITCQGIDIVKNCPVVRNYSNASYQNTDFENKIYTLKNKFDVLWCHDSFQYAINPIQTLINWREITTNGAMLCIILPQTTNIYHRELDFTQQNGVYYHYTLVNLIHMLALTGWDCNIGFFKKLPNDPWIHAVVYKSEQEPRDPKTTTWQELADANLLPDSAKKSIKSTGYLEQKDLILPWLDKSLAHMGLQ